MSLRLRETADAYQVLVDDSGRIDPEIVPRIMEPFFTTKAIGKGTGLGLSISKSIAESHGGHLELDPTADHTCFVLTLPKEPLKTRAQAQP